MQIEHHDIAGLRRGVQRGGGAFKQRMGAQPLGGDDPAVFRQAAEQVAEHIGPVRQVADPLPRILAEQEVEDRSGQQRGEGQPSGTCGPVPGGRNSAPRQVQQRGGSSVIDGGGVENGGRQQQRGDFDAVLHDQIFQFRGALQADSGQQRQRRRRQPGTDQDRQPERRQQPRSEGEILPLEYGPPECGGTQERRQQHLRRSRSEIAVMEHLRIAAVCE